MAWKKFTWLFRMAWRDGRRNTGRLLLFMSSIVLGIGALVAINSFADNLSRQIDNEAKELLGADLEVQSQTPISDNVRVFFDSLGFQFSEEVSFASMVLFPAGGGTRLVNVRAVENSFPYYGVMEVEPMVAAGNFAGRQGALVDQTIMAQFGAKAGENVQVGNLQFRIAGMVKKVPGRTAIGTTVAPPVFIPFRLIEATGLLQKGSRMSYLIYVKFPQGFDESKIETLIAPKLKANDLEYDTVQDRKNDVGDAYKDLTGFLNLTAFIALLLGCIGVAGSVQVYMKEKVQLVAILRCVGASGNQAMLIFLIQILVLSGFGASIGAFFGTLVQLYLPALFGQFIPFDVDFSLSLPAIVEGLVTGILAAFLFALYPLLRIRKISPLKAIRASFEPSSRDFLPYLAFVFILCFAVLFAWRQLGSFVPALYFSGGLLAAFLLLAGLARLVIWAVRRFFPTRSTFILRQSLANLHRPNNQTLILVVTIGLGTALISLLMVTQDLLVNKVKFNSAPGERPNMILFDIQTPQLEGVDSLIADFAMPAMAEVPIVTMRLEMLQGKTVDQLRKVSESEIPDWVLDREYRVTYRDTLTSSETLVSGTLQPAPVAGLPIPISLEEGLAGDMGVKLGDKLSFNVQGAVLEAVVGSIRKIDWQRVQTNFLVIFPEGVLESAPKFHVVMTRFESTKQSAEFQGAVVRKFPNISIIDLNLILSTVDEVLSKVSFIIRFMAIFSISSGLLVLIGSVMLSKYQRMRESVLLRTLGASRSQILKINTLEYVFLGSIASFLGIFIALAAGWALARFSFGTTLSPNVVALLVGYFAITGLTVVIGLSNSRSVVRKSPLEVLRSEG